jgi:hypothetical protein
MPSSYLVCQLGDAVLRLECVVKVFTAGGEEHQQHCIPAAVKTAAAQQHALLDCTAVEKQVCKEVTADAATRNGIMWLQPDPLSSPLLVPGPVPARCLAALPGVGGGH